jgi:NAD(P)-dependent dehydrogenase (short-subunit alcohol dehydrogenase family)
MTGRRVAVVTAAARGIGAARRLARDDCAVGALAELAPPPGSTLPNGFAVELAEDVHRSRDGRLMLGGSPPGCCGLASRRREFSNLAGSP